MKIVWFKRLVAGAFAVAAVFSVAASGVARAQGPMAGGGQVSPQQRNQAMYKELGFTPAQMTKMDALRKKYTSLVMTRITATQKKYGPKPTPDQQKKAMAEMKTMAMQVQAQAKKEMATFVTPAQMAKLNAKMAAAGRGAKP